MFGIIVDFIGWVFIIAGIFFTVTGSIGMLRMPDFYTRIHTAGLTDSLGAPLVLLGIAVLTGFSLLSLKIILLIIFLYITSPAATHAIAKTALLSGLKPLGREDNRR